MLIEQVAELSALDRFVYWIRERYQIHCRRKVGKPKPWTDDSVLQSYFFTNPYREHDKVTTWFRETIRDRLAEEEKVVFATVAFRWFNYIPTGELLRHNYGWESGTKSASVTCLDYSPLCLWNCERVVKLLSLHRDNGQQIFTGAFNISNSGSTKPKVNRVCEDYITPVWEDRDVLLEELKRGAYERKSTMQGVHELLMDYPGLRGSGFMAYEIVCDLRYTWVLRDAPDKCAWSNPGPGAKRGINRLLGNPLEGRLDKKDWETESRKLLLTLQRRLPRMPPLEMREVEHSLCEFDKYERARLGDGHMKRRYSGR